MNGIQRIEAKSLKAHCIETLERLIISGELAVGEAMPPERDLARRLGVSRPVVHEAMVELAAKGFVSVVPRRGVHVNDYYRNGTLAIFESIVLHADGDFPKAVLADIVGFRALIELEAVRLAAAGRGGDFLAALASCIEEESRLADGEASLDERVALDLRFHLLITEASGNRILPLVVNSIAPLYRSLVERFYAGRPDLGLVLGWHRDLVAAIAAGRVEAALEVASALLAHGAEAIGAEPRG